MFSHYNTYADIKRRKNESRTYFFDRATERLNRRMMRDEEAERKRRWSKKISDKSALIYYEKNKKSFYYICIIKYKLYFCNTISPLGGKY